MTKRAGPQAATQPELPAYFGRKPDRVVVNLSGQPYQSVRECFDPHDDEPVYLLVRCTVGAGSFKREDGALVFRENLTAVEAYPVDPEWGADRLEQLGLAHERREDQARRDHAKATAGEGHLDFTPGDPRLDELSIDPNEPHEFAAGLDVDTCALPECGRPPADPLHNITAPPPEEDPPA